MMAKAATKSYKSLNTIKQYFTLDSTDYWHLQYPLNNTWEEYFWDMSQKAVDCSLPRDDNGITLYIGEDGKMYYSMIEVAQYGMASYQCFQKTGHKGWLKEAEKHTNFLINEIKTYKSAENALINKYPIKLYDLQNEWVSSLAYGVLISLLIRLYKIGSNEKYLKIAEKLGENYSLDISEGGIKRTIYNSSLTIYEEYPTSEISGVLNGHITSLWALYDLSKYEESFQKLFQIRAKELANNLGAWDAGYWSYYDLKHITMGENNLASAHYHMLHIKQLLIMYHLSGFSSFAEFAEKFIRNKYSGLSRIKAFTGKTFFRIKKDFFKH